MAFLGVLEKLADERSIKILKVFAVKPDAGFTMAEIQKKTKLPAATTFRQLKALAQKGFLSVSTIKHVSIYRLAQNDLTQTVASLLYEHPEPLRMFLEKVEELRGVEEVMMHGKTENGANLVVVGHEVPKNPINEAVAFILDRYSYKINHLVVEPEQYETMANMGLYPQIRTVLYRKL
jgi:hypothetical protein